MTIRLVVTREGEQIICGIKEWMSGPGADARVIGYILNRPCLVDLEIDSDNDDNFRVRMVPWIPLAKDLNIPIPADYVVSMLLLSVKFWNFMIGISSVHPNQI